MPMTRRLSAGLAVLSYVPMEEVVTIKAVAVPGRLGAFRLGPTGSCFIQVSLNKS